MDMRRLRGGEWGGLAVGNGEYEGEKAIFRCLDSLFFFLIYLLLLRVPGSVSPSSARPCRVSHLYLRLYNNVNY